MLSIVFPSLPAGLGASGSPGSCTGAVFADYKRSRAASARRRFVAAIALVLIASFVTLASGDNYVCGTPATCLQYVGRRRSSTTCGCNATCGANMCCAPSLCPNGNIMQINGSCQALPSGSTICPTGYTLSASLTGSSLIISSVGTFITNIRYCTGSFALLDGSFLTLLANFCATTNSSDCSTCVACNSGYMLCPTTSLCVPTSLRFDLL